MKSEKTKTKTLSQESAIEALKSVEDPELGIDVWNLGLIYKIDIKEKNKINIDMTFTTPFCPYGPTLIEDVKDSLKKAGFKTPEVEITFEPPWEPTDEVKMMLGLI